VLIFTKAKNTFFYVNLLVVFPHLGGSLKAEGFGDGQYHKPSPSCA